MTTKFKLTHRFIYFAAIGSGAALVHILTVLALVSFLQLKPLIANIFAFLLAFNVSFFGHRALTFSQLDGQKQLSFPHFFLVASSAGIINEALYFFLLNNTSLNYLIALTLVLGFISIYSFFLSKIWACR